MVLNAVNYSVKNYRLLFNDEPIVDVDVAHPIWLPIKPTINIAWLRAMVTRALRAAVDRSL
jgi:hypothetical protein